MFPYQVAEAVFDFKGPAIKREGLLGLTDCKLDDFQGLIKESLTVGNTFLFHISDHTRCMNVNQPHCCLTVRKYIFPLFYF